MRIRKRRLSTSENNALTLPKGHVVSDQEAHALRLHNDQTPGGFVVSASKVELPNGPGPTTLQAGDTTAGFYGEVPASELIDGTSLSSTVGLTAGEEKDTDVGWLKCSLDNRVLFIAKHTLRGNIEWGEIYSAGLVYGLDRSDTETITQITLEGRQYVVRLLKGANEDPTTLPPEADWLDPSAADQSEWKRLMQSLEQDSRWGGFTGTDIGFTNSNGNQTWCQETCSADGAYHVLRGVHDSLDLYTRPDPGKTSYRGWRPVLELVL